MDPSPPSAGCMRCGVCCHSTSENYVRVTGEDWQRLGADAERVAHFIGHRAYLRMRAGHCIALEKRTTTDNHGHAIIEFFCSIYDQRPQICRDLARGSPECLGELTRKANPAFP